MNKLILFLGFLILAIPSKSQPFMLSADSFYCFYVPVHLNPLQAFIESREIKDSGRKGRVDYIFDEEAKTVMVKTTTYKYTYILAEKNIGDPKVTSYRVRDNEYEFYFFISRQSKELINLYCFYPDGDVNRGWQSAINISH